jgi:hypothetical protein
VEVSSDSPLQPIRPAGLEAPRHSSAVAGIVTANAVTLGLALLLDWPVGTLLWPYWLQSVVIGYYARKRILALTRFSTEGFMINDREVDPTPETKRSTATFFVIHYGFFHFGYAVFLTVLVPPKLMDLPFIGVALVAFILSHQRSFRENVARDLAGCPNIGTLMFLPYARVVPMHLVIIAGAGFVGGTSRLVLVGFALLKTGADLLMHHVEHRVLARSS